MKVVCAWCKKVLVDGDDELISHGICEDCTKKVMLELENYKKEEENNHA